MLVHYNVLVHYKQSPQTAFWIGEQTGTLKDSGERPDAHLD